MILVFLSRSIVIKLNIPPARLYIMADTPPNSKPDSKIRARLTERAYDAPIL